MSDKLFYPLTALFVAAMILGALYAGGPLDAGTQPDIDPERDGYVAEGNSLRVLVASPGTTVDYSVSNEGQTAYATAAAHMRRADAPPSAGVFAELGPQYEAAFAEKPLIVTVRARRGINTPSAVFTLSYHTASVGDSDAQAFTLTNQFEDYAIEFTPNRPKGDPGTDYIGVWPDVSGQSGTVDIERISVQVKRPALRGSEAPTQSPDFADPEPEDG